MLSDLSGVWRFRLDDGKGFEQGWTSAPLPDAMTMPVPASYNDIKEGVSFRDHYGWVFYQRSLSVPAYVRERQRVVLRCDAVTHHARVYLNGVLLTEHFGGFLPFEVELNEALREGENLLTIAVDNVIDYTTLPVGGDKPMLSMPLGGAARLPVKKQNNPNFDFFNYCGITRPVRLYTTPKTYLADISLWADVADPLAEEVSAVLHYQAEVCGPQAGVSPVKVELFDKAGVKVAESCGAEGALHLEHVTLWQPLKAYLYEVRVTAGEDVYTLPYGIRTVKVEGRRFLINGRPFYFKGYGWYVGAPDLEGPEMLLREELKAWEALGKPLVITEHGADTVMGFHDTTPVMYTEEYQLAYYEMNNRVFDEFPFVVGEHVWNFADFATSQGLLRVQGNKKGLFTRDRKPKLAAHYFRRRWTAIPDFGYKA